MFTRQRFAFPAMGEDHVRFVENVEFDVGCVAVIGMENDVTRVSGRLHKVDNGLRGHTVPAVVIPAPCSHTMNVANITRLRQCHKVGKRQCDSVFNRPFNTQPPFVC